MATSNNRKRKRMSEEQQKLTLLATLNAHPRDKRIGFEEKTHTYTVDGSYDGWVSCTKFLHAFFGHFDPHAALRAIKRSKTYHTSKYFGKSDKEVLDGWTNSGKEASTSGTALHLGIEQYFNGALDSIDKSLQVTKDWKFFQNFVKDHADWEPYRSEWEVFATEYKLAGSIDAVFRRKSDGKYIICDWKRSKEIKLCNDFEKGFPPLDHIDNSNYWHYTLQLNIYKWFLETYYGLEIADLYIVVFHPDNKNYKKMRLNMVPDEVNDMLECRKNALTSGGKSIVVLPM